MSRRRRQSQTSIQGIGFRLSSYLERVVYLILCFQIASTAIYYNPYLNPLIHKMLLGQFLALTAWLIFALHSIVAGRLVIRRSPYYLPLLALGVWVGIRSFTAPNADAVRNYWIFINILSTFPLWVTGFRHAYVRRLFVWTVLFAGIAMALGCLRQMIHSDPRIDWPFFRAITLSPGSYDRQRLGSFMGHNNESTAYLASACIYAGLLWTLHRRKIVSALFGGFILIAAVFIYLGASRGVAVMLAAALAVLLLGWFRNYRYAGRGWAFSSWMENRNWKKYGGILLAAAIVLAVFLSWLPLEQKNMQGMWSRFLSPPEHLVSGTYPRVWLMSLLMARDNPLLGVGFSAWQYRYPDYQKEWFTAYPDTRIGLPIIATHSMHGHNDYLQLWAELGLGGLVCLIWLLWIHFRSMKRILFSPAIAPFALFALAATWGTLARTIFAFPFHYAAASCLFIAEVGLVSSQVYQREWNWSLRRDGRNPGIRWAAGFLAIVFFLGLSYPNWVILVTDYAARLHGRKAEEAKLFLQQNDTTNYANALNDGYLAMQHSVERLSHQGKYLHEIGAETLQRGLFARDEKILLQAIEYLKQSEKSYGFYRTHEYLGSANRALWEITQNPEYWEESLKEFQEASAIMPTCGPAWAQQAFLLAKAGREKECLELLANTELRFPGFIERDWMNLARSESAAVDKAVCFELAISIIPSNENMLREILLHFLGIGQIDRAVYLYTQMASYQPRQSMLDWLTTFLQTLLENGRVQVAVGMMRELRQQPALNTIPEIWYYSGVTAWLAGYQEEAVQSWNSARECGVPMDRIDSSLAAMLGHVCLSKAVW